MNTSYTMVQPRLGSDTRTETGKLGRLAATVRGAPRWAVAGALMAIAALVYFATAATPAPQYATALVTRGTVAPAVGATGTLNPVTTVQVGSYVSGPIQAIYADFNSPVKKGQLIARIDPRSFQVKVDQARAALANAQAQLGKDQADAEYKKINYQRQEQLLKAQVVAADAADSARSAYLQAQAQIALDRANIAQQQSALNEAQVNLDYTSIVSPVDGTVVSRNVDVGQTVAASFQTPTLFLIAKDLTRMQVDTNVSESDIGGIKPGQRATFTVDAFPNRTFQGVVGQVRQAPITVQNVVTYDVVVSVPNPEWLLKPGMTANVTLEIAHRDDVLRVPVQALQFNPDGWSSKTAQPDADAKRTAVWVEDGGDLRRVAVNTGISDGEYIEIEGGDVHQGQAVVVGEVKAGSARSGQSSPLTAPRFVR
jgi:HlyD family secretion protein